jgi:hypothetical protein
MNTISNSQETRVIKVIVRSWLIELPTVREEDVNPEEVAAEWIEVGPSGDLQFWSTNPATGRKYCWYVIAAGGWLSVSTGEGVDEVTEITINLS